ncbi:hypothetical protein, partial [Frigoribacterium sp. MEB024]|uniref:hypothetical protein n=1 Tax=Frigoribacterium sp. MEB024 TaxID=1589899 RepID=UPI0018CCBE58
MSDQGEPRHDRPEATTGGDGAGPRDAATVPSAGSGSSVWRWVSSRPRGVLVAAGVLVFALLGGGAVAAGAATAPDA